MAVDINAISKKVQYITVDSAFVQGTNNTFTVNFGSSSTSTIVNQTVNNYTYTGSNVFVQEIRNVIGLKLVDFYVTQIGSNSSNLTSSTPDVKYIDILCPDIPDAAQILDERKGKIFARVPLERNFGNSANVVVNDKQWKSFNRQTNYFNPLSIKSLSFQIYEMQGADSGGGYVLLQPDATFYMILEVTTIDNNVVTLPKEDPTVKVVQAIEVLTEKFEKLSELIPELLETREPIKIEVPAPIETPTSLPEEPKIQQPADSKKMYYIFAILAILLAYFLFSKGPKQ